MTQNAALINHNEKNRAKTESTRSADANVLSSVFEGKTLLQKLGDSCEHADTSSAGLRHLSKGLQRKFARPDSGRQRDTVLLQELFASHKSADKVNETEQDAGRLKKDQARVNDGAKARSQRSLRRSRLSAKNQHMT